MKQESSKMLDTDKRVYEYSLMLSLAELEHLDELARQCKMNKASYIRALIFNRLPVVLPTPSAKLLADFGRAGNNVNQIARAINLKNPQLIDDVEFSLNELRLALMGAKL